MGILNKIFGNKKETPVNVPEKHNEKAEAATELTPKKKAYTEKFCEDDTPGWTAIDEALNSIYPDKSW